MIAQQCPSTNNTSLAEVNTKVYDLISLVHSAAPDVDNVFLHLYDVVDLCKIAVSTASGGKKLVWKRLILVSEIVDGLQLLQLEPQELQPQAP